MSLKGKTDEQRDQVDCGSIHSDITTDSAIGYSLGSLYLDVKAVTESDAPGNMSCGGSIIQAGLTESDAVPCTLHLHQPSVYNDMPLSEILARRSREPLQPSVSTEASSTLCPSSRQECHKVPVEQAEACTQETVSFTNVRCRGADQTLIETEQMQLRPERVKEEPEFFDVAMVYCPEDEELAKKFGEILQRFIILDDQQKPRIYMDSLDLRDALGGDEIEHFNYVLGCSSFAFVFFSPKSVSPKDLKGKWDRTFALHGSITDENCARVVPIVTEPRLKLGYSFGSLTKISLQSLLLGGRTLDLVSVDDLKMEHFEKRLLNRISRDLNSARAKLRCKVANCGVSNFEQSADAKQSTTQTVYHTELLQTHYNILVDSMDTQFGLLTYLFSEEVLSQREMENITAEKTRHGRNEKLLNLLYLKDAKSFEKFVCGLSESNQDYLAKRLCDPTHK